MTTKRREFLGWLSGTSAFAFLGTPAVFRSQTASGTAHPAPIDDRFDVSWADRVQGKFRAVFDSPEESGKRIPFSVADRGICSSSQVVQAFLSLLSLPATRLEATSVLRILETEPVRAKFGLAEPDLDAAIAAFRTAGYPGYWIHYSPIAAPTELPRWLEARGFTIPPRRSWAKMLRGNEAPPEVDVRFEVREARRGEESALAQVVCSAFGIPPSFVPWIAALSHRPSWRAFAALNNKQVIGAGYLYADGSSAWLGVGGVLPEARGHNAHRALMSIRIREAIAAGCTRIATETGEPVGDEPNPSLANMRYCGFRQVCSRINYAAKA